MASLFDAPALNPGAADDKGVRWKQSFTAFVSDNDDRSQFIASNQDPDGNTPANFQDQTGATKGIDYLNLQHIRDTAILNLVNSLGGLSTGSVEDYHVAYRNPADGMVWDFAVADDVNDQDPYEIPTTQAILDAIKAVIDGSGTVDAIIFDLSVADDLAGFDAATLTYDETTAHAIDGGDIDVAVAVSEAAGTRTGATTAHAIDGGDIDVAVAVSEAAGTRTGATTAHAIDGGDIDVAIAVSEAAGLLPSQVSAQAGEDQTVAAGTQVNLNGSGSTSTDGIIVGYEWHQITGPRVGLRRPFEVVATFQAPSFLADTILSFALVARDDQGASGQDVVSVRVNQAPSLAQRPIQELLDSLEHLDLLIEQYDESTRLRALVSGLIDIAQERIVVPMAQVQRGLNPDVSEGIILDWLGVRLNLERPYVTASDAEYFGFLGTQARGGRTFGQAPFFTARAGVEDLEPIGDETYRTLLKARARRLRGGADRETIEDVLAILFGNGYLDESDPADLTLRVIVPVGGGVIYGLVIGRLFEKIIPRPAGRALSMAMITP